MVAVLLLALTLPGLASQASTNVISDSWITMKIHSQFIPEASLDGSDIDVDTTGGVVTLSGTVTSEPGRERALAVAKATDGVKNVVDKLRVGPAEGAISTGAAKEAAREVGAAARAAGQDATAAAGTVGRTVNNGWIKSKIYAQFLVEDALDDSDIDIGVTNGVVTLNGTVTSEAGRARALAIAKATDGVKSVRDSLRIGGKA